MRGLGTDKVLASLLLSGVIGSSAIAQTPGDPGVTTPSSFTSIPATVPASTIESAEVYVVYPVTLNNGSGSSINNIRVSGNANSTSLVLTPDFATVGTSPFVCEVTSPGPSKDVDFTCSIPSAYALPAGQSLTLPLGFKLQGLRAAGESVSFSFSALFREGNSTNPGGNSDARLSGSTQTVVSAVSTNSVAALIPLKTGAKFFTGPKGVPVGSLDAVATIVEAPATPTSSYASATIFEIPVTSANPCPVLNSGCKDLVKLDILDKNGNKQRFDPSPVTNPLAEYLLITLRRDASAFKGSVNNVNVYYDGGLGYEPVPACVNGADPLLGLQRCVYDRRVFKRNDLEVRADPDLLGDAQIRILARENGFFAW